MRRDGLPGMATERIAVARPSPDSNHLEALREQASEGEVVHGGQELSRRQVPGGAEDHQRRGRRKGLGDVLGEWVRLHVLGAHTGSRPGTGGAGLELSTSSSPASSAAPRTPASWPWRASRISVRSPTPGSTNRRATIFAGPSSRSPAVETPPPIATTSGSKVLIALAIP